MRSLDAFEIGHFETHALLVVARSTQFPEWLRELLNIVFGRTFESEFSLPLRQSRTFEPDKHDGFRSAAKSVDLFHGNVRTFITIHAPSAEISRIMGELGSLIRIRE